MAAARPRSGPAEVRTRASGAMDPGRRVLDDSLAALFLGVTLELPAAIVSVLEDLFRAAHLGVQGRLYPERPTDLVDDALIGCGHGAAYRFLARALRTPPVGVHVPARQGRAGSVARVGLARELLGRGAGLRSY